MAPAGGLPAPGALTEFRYALELEAAHNQEMSDRDDFLAWVNSRVRDAEIAVHDGDASHAARFGRAKNQLPSSVLRRALRDAPNSMNFSAGWSRARSGL